MHVESMSKSVSNNADTQSLWYTFQRKHTEAVSYWLIKVVVDACFAVKLFLNRWTLKKIDVNKPF